MVLCKRSKSTRQIKNYCITVFRKLVIEYMGEILILDQVKADILQSLGFKYTKRNIDNKEVFVFIQTNELIKELDSKFEQGSFLFNPNVCF